MSDLIKMRRIAAGALVVVFVGMIVFRILEARDPVWGYFRAFCEAATVGALADWFAVVALFRHPLGLPIPHTAILPKNKSRIAASLADFFDTNFLLSEELSRRLRAVDFAGLLTSWTEKNGSLLIPKIESWVQVRLGDPEKNATLRVALAAELRAAASRAESAPLLAKALHVALADGRDHELFQMIARSLQAAVSDHRETIQEVIRREIPLSSDMLRSIPALSRVSPALDSIRDQIARVIADRTVERLSAIAQDAALDPGHPVRAAYDTQVAKMLLALESSPVVRERAGEFQTEWILRADWNALASRLLDLVREMLSEPDATGSSRLGGWIASMQAALVTELRTAAGAAALNDWAANQLIGLIPTLRPALRDYIVKTVESWDAEALASRLEGTVGRDLQFIRLNGTIIGGCIGVAIHAGFQLAGI